MNKTILVLLFSLLISSSLPAEDQHWRGTQSASNSRSGLDSVFEAWVARYSGPGGPGNAIDHPTDLTVDGGGNVYVTGYSDGLGTSSDYATIKYDTTGGEQWVVRYDGGNGADYAYSLAVDGGGNVYVTGESSSSGVQGDYVTIKYDATGGEQWVARYNGPANRYDVAKALAVDGRGNVYVTGQSYDVDHSSYATVKYDASGVEQWVARYNGPGNGLDGAHALAIDESGNVYVTGASGYFPDCTTIKYDSSGAEQWVARYNGPGNLFDWGNALAVDRRGNVYVTGPSDGTNAPDYATIKYDASGAELWVARYNGPGDYDDHANDLAIDDSGNVYVTGRSYGSGTDWDYATIKYDSSGQERWIARYDGGGYDEATALAVDENGNGYVTGESIGSGTLHDYATIKYDAAGIERWIARYDGPGSSLDAATALAVDRIGNVYTTGYTGEYPRYNYTTIKYVQPPAQVAPLSPPDRATITADSVTLVYQSLAGVDRYWVEGSIDSLFTVSFVDSLVTDTTFTVNPLYHNQMYWWKVRAHNSIGWGTFSAVRSFFVYLEVPAPPILLSPENGSSGVSTSPTLSWNASAGAESYSLQLADTVDFSRLIVDEGSIGVTSFDVTDLSNTVHYYWRVSATNALGVGAWSDAWSFTTLLTGVRTEAEIPTEFSLSQNYPNPFNPSTVIRYGLPKRSHVKLELFNLIGQRVVMLVDSEQETGYHSAVLRSTQLASGLYFYRLQAGEYTETKKLVLLR